MKWGYREMKQRDRKIEWSKKKMKQRDRKLEQRDRKMKQRDRKKGLGINILFMLYKYFL